MIYACGMYRWSSAALQRFLCVNNVGEKAAGGGKRAAVHPVHFPLVFELLFDDGPSSSSSSSVADAHSMDEPLLGLGSGVSLGPLGLASLCI